jgi:ABC-type branched-subunit amino acid transport system permease subunit
MRSQTKDPASLVVLDGAVRTIGVLLLALGSFKLLGIIYVKDPLLKSYLTFPNPIFSWESNGAVLTLAALIEIIAGWLALRRSGFYRAFILLWFASAALLYKIALIYVAYKGPCGCLFGINSILPLSVSTQRTVSDFILAATLVTGLIAVACWRLASRPEPSEMSAESLSDRG